MVTVHLPPLRDRREAVPLLVEQFLQKNNEQYRKNVTQLSPGAIEILKKSHWPGNVRELETLVRRMVVLGNEDAVVEEIKLTGSRQQAREEASDSLDLAALGADFSSEQGIDLKAISRRAAQLAEKGVIEKVLQETRWNRKAAAQRLQISYKALLYKMKENGLSQNR